MTSEMWSEMSFESWRLPVNTWNTGNTRLTLFRVGSVVLEGWKTLI